MLLQDSYYGDLYLNKMNNLQNILEKKKRMS